MEVISFITQAITSNAKVFQSVDYDFRTMWNQFTIAKLKFREKTKHQITASEIYKEFHNKDNYKSVPNFKVQTSYEHPL